jgi:hypothetical protein
MSAWTEQRVLDAAAAMEFVPEGAIDIPGEVRRRFFPGLKARISASRSL